MIEHETVPPVYTRHFNSSVGPEQSFELPAIFGDKVFYQCNLNFTQTCNDQDLFEVVLTVRRAFLGIFLLFYLSVFILIIWSTKKLNHAFYVCVLNLGVADMLTTVLVIVPWFNFVSPCQEEYGLWVFIYTFQSMWYAIMLHTAFLAFTRLVTVFSKTISPDILTLKTMLLVSLVLWSLAFLIPIPMLVPGFTRGAKFKDMHFNFFNLNKAFAIFDLIFQFSFVVFFMVSYLAIFLFIHKHKRQAKKSLNDKPERTAGSKDTRILIQATLISACFLVAQITTYSQRIIGTCSTAYLNAASNFIFLTINPFIYLALSAQLRQMYYESYIKPIVKFRNN